MELDKFGDRLIFMSMFNDIDWTRKENEDKCFFPEKSQCTRRNSPKDIGRFWVLETKRSGMEAVITNQHQIFTSERQELWNPEKLNSKQKPHVSLRMLRMQNFYAESFTQKSSSISTGQFHTGVDSLVQTRLSLSQKSS